MNTVEVVFYTVVLCVVLVGNAVLQVWLPPKSGGRPAGWWSLNRERRNRVRERERFRLKVVAECEAEYEYRLRNPSFVPHPSIRCVDCGRRGGVRSSNIYAICNGCELVRWESLVATRRRATAGRVHRAFLRLPVFRQG